jgi:hypothetical protein
LSWYSWRKASIFAAMCHSDRARLLLNDTSELLTRAHAASSALAKALPRQSYVGMPAVILRLAALLLPRASRWRWLDDWYGEMCSLDDSRKVRFVFQILRAMPRMAVDLRITTEREVSG